MNKSKRCTKQIFRGAELFAIGLLITVTTWIFFPKQAIFFGILHLLGIAVMCAPLFRKLNLVLGIIFIALGAFLNTVVVKTPLLLWLGLAPVNFTTFDYFPLLPWLGFFLVGMFIGNYFYKNGERTFGLSNVPALSRPLSFLGRHSLLIYIIHQPVLLGVLILGGLVAI